MVGCREHSGQAREKPGHRSPHCASVVLYGSISVQSQPSDSIIREMGDDDYLMKNHQMYRLVSFFY